MASVKLTFFKLLSPIIMFCTYYVVGGDMFEGDIAGIDGIQLAASLQGRIAYNALRGEEYRWNRGIVPYQISTQFTSNEKMLILKAMRGFHNSTCVRFVERIDEESFIYLLPVDNGCWSFVGRQRHSQSIGLQQSGMDEVISAKDILHSISFPGCMTIGTIQHELMHALGFYHEQSRTDRDEFVNIFWENIDEERFKTNFLSYTDKNITSFGLPYDFDSIMHYGQNAFVRANTISIAPKFQYRDKQIGQQHVLSPIDIKKINLMHNCSERQALPLDPTKIFEAKGWGISFPENFVSKAIITLPDAQNSRTCLENCYFHTRSACRLVSFNLNTRECVGFGVDMEGTFHPKSLYMSLLTVSQKQFSSKNGYFADPNSSSNIRGADGADVANGRLVYGEAQCVLLCHLHPKCKATVSLRDRNSVGSCYLKTAGTSLTADADWVSYFTEIN